MLSDLNPIVYFFVLAKKFRISKKIHEKIILKLKKLLPLLSEIIEESFIEEIIKNNLNK